MKKSALFLGSVLLLAAVSSQAGPRKEDQRSTDSYVAGILTKYSSQEVVGNFRLDSLKQGSTFFLSDSRALQSHSDVSIYQKGQLLASKDQIDAAQPYAVIRLKSKTTKTKPLLSPGRVDVNPSPVHRSSVENVMYFDVTDPDSPIASIEIHAMGPNWQGMPMNVHMLTSALQNAFVYNGPLSYQSGFKAPNVITATPAQYIPTEDTDESSFGAPVEKR